jgi:hypothetical protein
MTDEAMSPLRRRMIEDMTIRKLAPKTQEGYIGTVRTLPRLSAALPIERALKMSGVFNCILLSAARRRPCSIILCLRCGSSSESRAEPKIREA